MKTNAFQNHLRLPTVSFRMNGRNKKIILNEPGSSKFLHGSFFFTSVRSWNSLPIELRTIEYKRENGRNLSKNACYCFTKNVQHFIKPKHGEASNFSNGIEMLFNFSLGCINTPTIPTEFILFFIKYSN